MSANYCNCPNCRTVDCPNGDVCKPDGRSSLALATGSAFSYVPLPDVMAMLADPVRLRAHILRHGPPGYDLIDRTQFDKAELERSAMSALENIICPCCGKVHDSTACRTTDRGAHCAGATGSGILQPHTQRPAAFQSWFDALKRDNKHWQLNNREQAVAFAAFIAGWYLRTGEDPDSFSSPNIGDELQGPKTK